MDKIKERHQEIADALPTDLGALPLRDGFRLRGLAMTRLETFIDAAFAFATTNADDRGLLHLPSPNLGVRL